ncbi:MAG: tetraacyldisaccharide 4'-kinase [Cytophagales bacterium CG12_big_fil_rev_8_21_14_0_65_40_12]|nr:MAG: tetraacyldisaccharide 4'-kinase [Cytophagales bacterium CG12_big_fil_rev_8_21_14_0_65_40_12]PIW05189.1 MAG: tetraacyldisaccharide 4'-kinase [Cytophagales bacterium CG17_big_fil_post_rev_8_21_14_2_50_40_13]
MKLLQWLLFPISVLYGGIMSFRNHLYDIGKKPQVEFDRTIIAIGNLSMGGTGKTPMVEYLISTLKGHYKLATLSRGYGRKTQGYRMVKADDNASTVGDEPYQYFLKFGDEVKVCVGEERILAIPSAILESEEIEVFLLDDAFQHRKVARDLNILLSDYHRPFYDDYILPTGELREGRNGAARADVIMITKCPTGLDEIRKDKITQAVQVYSGDKPIFFSSIVYGEPKPVLKSEKRQLKAHSEVIMLTSIADNRTFKNQIENDFSIVKEFVFEDHHRFSTKDLNGILTFVKAAKASNLSLVTTEKDMVRLLTMAEHPIFDALGIFYIPIKFQVDKEEEFKNLLFKVIEENKNLH